jgi:DNA sulfur modification protein DndE
MKNSIGYASPVFVAVVFALASGCMTPPAAGPTASVRMGGFIMPQVAEPQFPDRTARITDFGAVAGGQVLITDAIAKGINTLSAQGGGKLIIPAGLWLTGPIVLKSNIELVAEEGALVQFTKDTKQYKGRALIYGENLENVAITGRGIFDGGGEAWRPVKHAKMTEPAWKALLASGGHLDPDSDIWTPPGVDGFRRPNMLILSRCRRVLLDGTTFENSPAWDLNPSYCDDVTIRNVTIRNPYFAQNGDGLDLESCRNVIIRGDRLDVGDDGLCMKSGVRGRANRNGPTTLRPTENVLIEDCVVYHAHGGFTIGSEMSGDVRNILVQNCSFIGTDVGLRFKTQRGRGGIVENIYVRNISMTDIVTDAISFDMYYGGAAPTEKGAQPRAAKPVPVSDGTPQFRELYIENITCRGAQRAVQLQGLPEMPIRGIHLKHVSITADTGLVCEDARDITLDHVEILRRQGPVADFKTSRDVRVDDLAYGAGAPTLFRVEGAGNSGIAVSNTDVKGTAQALELAKGATAAAIEIK